MGDTLATDDFGSSVSEGPPLPHLGNHSMDVGGSKNMDLAYDMEAMSSASPFYAQLDAISPSQYQSEPPQPNSAGMFSYPSSMHHIDMTSLDGALPDTGLPSRKLSHNYQYHSNTSSYGTQAYSPSGTGFAPEHMSPIGVHMPHYGQPSYPSSARVGQTNQGYSAYGSYAPYPSFATQPSIPSPIHGLHGFPAPYGSPYAQAEAYTQMSHMPFPTMDNRSYMSVPITHGDGGPVTPYSVPDPTPSYPRGPPRKPKQSGHALWVGNLPPGTTVIDLKDHFSREATRDIESLFLISKSNCAFVNYRSETACSAAMSRFHDSRFHGVRLVCRLRRGSAAAVTSSPSTPNGETPNSPIKADKVDRLSQRRRSEVVIASGSNTTTASPDCNGATTTATGSVPEKYFIVKSLTLQDLDASVRNGIWATQSHNEEALNKAFESAEHVYLIFSANKSGEYFGYARMASRISGEAVVISSQRQQQQQQEAPESATDGPQSIPTVPTEWAPAGRIVDDSARGTIFWEADAVETNGHDGVQNNSSEVDTTQSEQQQQQQPDDSRQGQDWGKPFQIEWLSTNRLPFYRTRGLRNPWNANREVKIARDGTELEPSVGKRLVQMFNRPVGPVVMPQGLPMQSQFQPY